MTRLVPALLLSALFLPAWSQEPDENVNSRYSVESIHISGNYASRISRPLRAEIDRLIGQKLDSTALDRLAARLRDELHARKVQVRVQRGTIPDHVAVVFEADKSPNEFDLDLHKFVYNSVLGLSGEGDATLKSHGNEFTAGLVDDGDELVERYAGFKARYARPTLGTGRLGFSFEFDTYHSQWNPTALGEPPDALYRVRQNFQPMLQVNLAPGLILASGVSFERLQNQLPAARFESANTVVNTLRYHRRWDESYVYQQELDAGYSLRAATHALNSDSIYARHSWDLRYTGRHDHNMVEVRFLAGAIEGNAPLFERFVLGNSTMLRGWNKFALDPLGGDRIVYGSLNYVYRIVEIFYDTGAIWNHGTDPNEKQSAGAGFRKDGFLLAVAFPLKNGRVEPMLIAGMNF